MGNVAKDQRFPRNPNYNDPGVLGGTWTNTVTGEVWECAGHYDINALKVADTGCIWYLKDATSSGSGGGAKEPYIEETYDANGYLTAAVMHGYTKVPSSKFPNNEKLQTFVDYGITIKNIENGAFYKCTSLVLTSLPSGVTSIGEGAFSDCTNLALTSLPGEITSLGQRAFKNCTALALTSLPNGLTSIPMETFYGCTNLALTSLPNGITSLGQDTFTGCANLALTSLPSGLTNLHQRTFKDCTNLALTSLPNGLTSIPAGAFLNCTSLALTSLPSGLTKILDNAFDSCTGLVSMSIPSGVSQIAKFAFRYCTGLTFVTFEGTPSSTIASNAFYGCTNITEIKVPWAEGAVANAPWGATNATVVYNYDPNVIVDQLYTSNEYALPGILDSYTTYTYYFTDGEDLMLPVSVGETVTVTIDGTSANFTIINSIESFTVGSYQVTFIYLDGNVPGLTGVVALGCDKDLSGKSVKISRVLQ